MYGGMATKVLEYAWQHAGAGWDKNGGEETKTSLLNPFSSARCFYTETQSFTNVISSQGKPD